MNDITRGSLAGFIAIVAMAAVVQLRSLVRRAAVMAPLLVMAAQGVRAAPPEQHHIEVTRDGRGFALAVLVLAAAAPIAGGELPEDWIEPATGHRVIRLSEEPGSASLYFHQNAYTTSGDKLVISTPQGLATVDLTAIDSAERPAIEQVVRGRAGNAVVGRKTRQVFYTRRSSIYATHLDTHATRLIGRLPPELGRSSMLAINADETLLASAAADLDPPGGSESEAQARSQTGDRRRAMVIYTMDIATGSVNIVLRGTHWFNHVQFSPSDPKLIMFCHEGPWHDVNRIWTILTDGTGLRHMHARTMDMEIAGHEFFSADGQSIWYDLQTPRGKEFWLAGVTVATDERVRYRVDREHWSVHYHQSPRGKRFAGDGGGPRSVAAPGNGQWIYLFTPQDGELKVEKLVDLSDHDYELEPNVTFTPDARWIVFRSNMHGAAHVYAAEVARSE